MSCRYFDVGGCQPRLRRSWRLTARRRHRALIAYLTSNNLTNTAAALRAELGLGEDVFDAATAKKYEGLLEKKWTSVVRLQKKVSRSSERAFRV